MKRDPTLVLYDYLYSQSGYRISYKKFEHKTLNYGEYTGHNDIEHAPEMIESICMHANSTLYIVVATNNDIQEDQEERAVGNKILAPRNQQLLVVCIVCMISATQHVH